MVLGQIQNMQLALVFAALPDAIEQQARVLRRALGSNRRGVVRTQRQGIQQEFVFAMKPFAAIHAPQVCASRALREKIIAILFIRSALGIMIGHLQQALVRFWPYRQTVQQGMSVGVFRRNPVARLLTLLVFQPAVRVYDLNAVNRLLYVVLPRNGWSGNLGKCRPRSTADKETQEYREMFHLAADDHRYHPFILQALSCSLAAESSCF